MILCSVKKSEPLKQCFSPLVADATVASKSREIDRVLWRFSAASGTGEKDGAALSSWARYLKNKYGNRGKENAARDAAAASSAAASSSSRRLSLGLPLRSNSTAVDSSDDDSKNMQRSPTSHTIIEAGAWTDKISHCVRVSTV